MLRLCGLAGKLRLGLEPEICAAKAGRFERGSVRSPGALKLLSSVSFQFSVFSFQFGGPLRLCVTDRAAECWPGAVRWCGRV